MDDFASCGGCPNCSASDVSEALDTEISRTLQWNVEMDEFLDSILTSEEEGLKRLCTSRSSSAWPSNTLMHEEEFTYVTNPLEPWRTAQGYAACR